MPAVPVSLVNLLSYLFFLFFFYKIWSDGSLTPILVLTPLPGLALVLQWYPGRMLGQGGDAEQHQYPSPWQIPQTTSFFSFLSFL